MKYNPYQKELEKLVASITEYLKQVDILMKRASTPERGGAMAKLSNALEMAKDMARFNVNGLNIDFRTLKVRPMQKPKVVIGVHGGIAEITKCPPWIDCEIIDHDIKRR